MSFFNRLLTSFVNLLPERLTRPFRPIRETINDIIPIVTRTLTQKRKTKTILPPPVVNNTLSLSNSQLFALGFDGDKKIAQANNFIKRFNIKNLDEFKEKAKQYLPNFVFFNDTNVSNYKLNNEEDVKQNNFKEILRISSLNDGFIRYNLNGDESIYNITENSIKSFKDLLEGTINDDDFGSDLELLAVFVNNIGDITGLDTTELDITQRKSVTAGFFPFNHTLNIDLSRYGIFRVGQDFADYHDNNCLYHALQSHGLPQKKLDSLRIYTFQRDIPISKLEDVANHLDIQIRLTKKIDDKTDKILYYGKENKGGIYKIVIIHNHFFINEENTGFTKFSIENYDRVKDLVDFHKITKECAKGDGFTRGQDPITLSSNRLIKKIEKYLIPLNKMEHLNTPYHSKIKNVDIKNLEYTENAARIFKPKEKQKKNQVLRVFFDFETVADENGIHRPRELFCAFKFGEKVFTRHYTGFKCGKQFIDFIRSLNTRKSNKSFVYDIHLIAHNCGFDFNFIAAYLGNFNICKVDNRFISAIVRTHKRKNVKDTEENKDNFKIVVKDSYNFIAKKLSDFPKMFGLKDIKKELFDHNWVKWDNIGEDGNFINDFIDVPKYVSVCDDYGNFDDIDFIPDDEYIENGKFNLKKYSAYYCELDVMVLMDGYNKFGEWSDDLGVSIDDVSTVSSLAKEYCTINGCYDEIYELSGIPQAYINSCVVGGRVMTQENKKIIKEDCEIVTLDGVSLYPSALSLMEGYMKGKPKVLNDKQINDFNLKKKNKYDYYFITIEILKVGVKLKMPLLYIKSEGSINYTNDLEGHIMYVGKAYFEDLIKFQKIEYKVLRGYYFNEGFNNKIIQVNQDLYDRRLELKKDGNKCEAVYKLILNSIYGKNLQKPVLKKLVVKKTYAEMGKYILRNKTKIECATKIFNSEMWIIREYSPIKEDFNMVHLGTHILDKSKRIMNEVICLAEECGFDVYYTDTDSLHLDLKNIKKLEKAYKETYGKDLIGGKLTQFQYDFGVDNKGNPIIATNSIFIAKKIYIDNKSDGKDIIRCKGVPTKAIMYKCRKDNCTPFELYKKFHKGEKVTFDLNCEGNNFCVQLHQNFSVLNHINFTRNICVED